MKKSGQHTDIDDAAQDDSGEGKPACMTRREFIRSAALVTGSLVISGFWQGGCTSLVNGGAGGVIAGASYGAGHKLRDGRFPEPEKTTDAGIVIVGGGISGLAAAWHLKEHGYADALMLELEPVTGGNSSSGSNSVSKYPWGAHYVPLPGPDAALVTKLFEKLGVIKGYKGGLPVYDETMLCADLSERLYINGVWQEGLVPQVGITEGDRRQFDRFFGLMEHIKRAKGADGLRAFTIPVHLSSSDPRFTALDSKSMARFMADNGFDSDYLLWYVDYCCRDDYGAGLSDISAWAGVHYFASRGAKAANAEAQAVLTWPEGNGWLAGRLKDISGIDARCGALVYNVENTDKGVIVDYYDTAAAATGRIRAEAAIVALPRFVAGRVVKELRVAGKTDAGMTYSPWVVANVTVRSSPADRAIIGSAPIAWDNVSYHSRSLGYTVATHQTSSARSGRTVLTWYMPLDGASPSKSREDAIKKTHAEWAEIVTQDLTRMHPGIAAEIENIDVWVWGHGMIRPVPGFIWGGARQKTAKRIGRISFGHSDMSGISIFEEALYRGASAAAEALLSIGRVKREGV